MNDLLKEIAEEKNVSPERLKYAMDVIAFHESKGDIKAKQKIKGGGIGVGRGKYQYEIGEDASAVTALNRAKNYYKMKNKPLPKWLSSLSNDFDPSELPEEQQDALFLLDHRMRPRSNFTELNERSVADWWADYHQTENDPVKIKRFEADESYYNANVNPDKKIDKAIEDIKPQGVTVERGDTLYSIAEKNNMKVTDLIKLNNITDPNRIMVGQTLKVN